MPLHATVGIRSYNRIEECCELVDACLEQDYSDFDILVVDQSTKPPEDGVGFDKYSGNSKVTIIKEPPLGGPRARNEVCRHAKGDVLILVDDDDLPIGTSWISAFMANFDDAKCLAVSGRHILEGGSEPPYVNMAKARKRVLSYNILMWPRVYARVDVKKKNISHIHGTNSAIRRSALERFGLWDTCTPFEDENSFCYKLLQGKEPDEYVAFDPDAQLLRRLEVPGGMGKRLMTAPRYAKGVFHFLHNIVAYYYPWRFWLLYPLYMWLTLWVTADWLWWESAKKRSSIGKVLAICGFGLVLPFLWLGWFAKWLGHRLKNGRPERAPRLPAQNEETRSAA